MSNDIQDILKKLTLLEGGIVSPALPKKGLDKQQKSVNQMPALFKSKNISPVLNGQPTYKKHPAAGKFVGGESKDTYCDACDRLESECVCDSKDCDITRPQNEDVLTTVRLGLNDYLKNIEQELDPDRALINKAKQEIQRPAVEKLLPIKTIKTHDGKELRIHGNEADGFIIKVNERPMRHRYDSLDEATMACEMYCNHRKDREMQEMGKDYVDES